MFQCKDLLSLSTMSRAKVAAGKGGMNREIRWAYKAESMNFAQWVKGQEMLIVSAPVIQRKNFDLYRLIQKALEQKMACALLLIGDGYIEKIDTEVMQLAERENFPLFTIPWDVPLLDLFEELGHSIAYLDDRYEIQDSLLAEIIFGNYLNVPKIERKCQQMGKESKILKQVFIIRLLREEWRESKDKVRCLAEKLEEICNTEGFMAIICCYGDCIIGFEEGKEEEKALLNQCLQMFSQYLAEEQLLRYTISIGKCCDTLMELRKSFHETMRMHALLEHMKRECEIIHYEEMSFFRLLLSYENREPMRQFAEEVLGGILKYDKESHMQLLDTLWCYFEENCKLQETADRLFSHKNTIKYRLQKIEKITGRKLHNRFQELELYNALLIYYFISD